MSHESQPPTSGITIHAFHPEAECDYSGKVGVEAVEISTADNSIQHAVISMPELTKLLRFRHRQGAKQNGAPDGHSLTGASVQ